MIEISHLTKRFGSLTALDDVTFSVQPGEIVGFLGPNGAGKSTCLNVLTGLVRADEGTASINGVAYRDLPNPARVAGSLLSTEAFHPGRTGAETLRLAALTLGLPKSRVAAVLDEVGLSPREAGRRVRAFSLGMRQRLGIAQALLGDPAALILDEPTNGLDPQGQRWLGELLRARAERGASVLLSSHQLHDVARLADRVVMLGHGRVLADVALGADAGMDAQAAGASGRDAAGRLTPAALEDLYFNLTAGSDRAA